MDYATFSQFAGTWGLTFLVIMFVLALFYALWPANAASFREASLLPLQEGPLEKERSFEAVSSPEEEKHRG